jgi:hypothetical protein
MALVREPDALAGNIETEDVLCFGDLTGTVRVSVTGGTTPYIYLWNTGATTPDLEDLAAGTYILTVTDANLCELVINAEVIGPDAATVQMWYHLPMFRNGRKRWQFHC